MMYNNKLSACIKVNGKVLREDGDKVYIPFGSEYTISIKNHNSIRAAVSIDIDSTDATGGHDLIIEPNATIELKRFIKNGNLSTGNAFKFIERTASIENHRGIGQSDGLVRLSYQFEQPRTTLVFHDVHHYYRDHYYRGMNIGDFNRTGTSIANNLTFGVSQHALRSAKSYTANVLTNNLVSPNAIIASTANLPPEVGITVPGQVTSQEFNIVSGFTKDGVDHVIMLQLFGQSDAGIQVVKPITVKTKLICSSCNKTNKSSNKYCSECGTGLHIV